MKRYLSIVYAALALFTAPLTAKADPPKFVVIVHAGVKQTSASADEVKALFAKKITRWKEDVAVVPFEQPLDSPVRGVFSEAIFHRSPAGVQAEWRQRIFTGQATPPKELKDDAAVIATVAATPGAIGYVAAGTPLPATVHVLNVAN